MDNEMFYDRHIFKSEEELKKKFKRYVKRTNNIERQVLEFKTPNEVMEEFKNAAFSNLFFRVCVTYV